ncbi:MAG: (2Fe-2S) ferredoxin domain-containing protein [Tissierellia bacterium]|nr:(2Fe-2S) ferredoxin domain-containing protein [Tissierellia bacterium]MDD4779648.1 (2Fe-2S) ferredoxin domain-containing protein [Tissierellia bacterium]
MVNLSICVGSACHLKGSYEVIEKFKTCVENNNLNDSIVIKASFCLGQCTEAVSVKYKDNIYSVTPETAEKFFDEVIKKSIA